MGPYCSQVTKHVGVVFLDIIKQCVIKHEINTQQMSDIAYLLHEHVGGNHARRQEDKNGKCDEPEFRNILSDWYSVGGMCKMEQSEVQSSLISIFRKVNLLPLANQLEKCQKTIGGNDVKTDDKMEVDPSQPSPVVCPAFGKITKNESGTSISLTFKPRSWPKGFKNSVSVPLGESDISIQIWKEANCDCVGFGHSVYKVKTADFAIPILLDIHLGSKTISTVTNSVKLEQKQTSEVIPPGKLKDCVTNESAFFFLLDNMSPIECKKELDIKKLMYSIAQNGAVSCLEYLDKSKKIEVYFFFIQTNNN